MTTLFLISLATLSICVLIKAREWVQSTDEFEEETSCVDIYLTDRLANNEPTRFEE